MAEKSELTSLRPVLPRANRERSTGKQFILGLVAYSISLAPSMSIGFSAVALPALRSDAQASLTDDQLSWFASIASIATPFGCLCSGRCSDRYGRKTVHLMVNIFAFLGWLLIAVAMDTSVYRYQLLLIGRLITGFSTGFASMPPVVYMSEVSTPQLRGVLTTANGIFFALGVLMVYVLGALFADNCGTVAAVTAVIPCISILLIIFLLPESPSWLVTQQRVDEAAANMQRIYGYDEYTKEIHDDLQLLCRHADANREMAKSSLSSSSVRHQMAPFLRPTCYKPFLIVQTFFFFQQFSGTFIIVFYAIDIVHLAGVTIDSYLAIVAIAFVRLLGALVVSYWSRTCGRRPISLVSGVGMAVCMSLLAAHIHQEWGEKVPWLPFACLVIYFFTSTLGFITMPFAIAAECFPAEIKGTVTGVITCLAYLFNFIVVKTYASLVASIAATGTFLFYAAFSIVGTLFIYFFLPETKGKTLAEISDYFSGRCKDKEEEKCSERLILKS